jgi:hypothetical protein
MEKKTDFNRFANALGSLAEVMGKEMTAIMSAAYFQVLKRWPIEQVERAIEMAMASCKFFPKPVEIIDLITGGKDAVESSAMVQAARALESLKRHGSYQSVVFDDPITQAVIQYGFGGWIKLGNDLTADNEGWFLKDFCKIYKAYTQQGISLTGHLAGLLERDNAAAGRLSAVPPPLLIGDAATALQISHSQPEDKLLLSNQAAEIVKRIGMEVPG